MKKTNHPGFTLINRWTIKGSHSGFTLIELLLYLGILASVILAVSIIYFTFLQVRIKNQTIAEVEGQVDSAMQIITQTIRNSVSITSPTIGTTGNILTLVVPDGTKSPTVFDLSSGALRIKEGAGLAVALTSPAVTISNLSFRNLSATGTFGTIRIQFTVTFVNTSGRNEYNFSKIVTGSASLRF